MVLAVKASRNRSIYKWGNSKLMKIDILGIKLKKKKWESILLVRRRAVRFRLRLPLASALVLLDFSCTGDAEARPAPPAHRRAARPTTRTRVVGPAPP